MSNFYKKENLPTIFFSIYIYSCIIGLVSIFLGIPYLSGDVFLDITNNLILPLLLVLHAKYTIGFIRGAFFILFSSLSGFLFEVSGLRYGALFDNPYIYNKAGLLLYGVPFNVVLYWGIFIYIGYSITNILLHKLKNTRINVIKKVVTDGLIVTAIDLLIDPIGVAAGNWTWINGGFYFGVPFGNFVSWFFIVAIVTSIFRIYEYFRPSKVKKINYSVKIIPIKIYIVLFMIYCTYAIFLGLYELLIVGTLPMLYVILIFYYRNQSKIEA